MRMILFTFIALILTSCKDWRQKRDERLFVKICERNPELCQTDSSAVITMFPKTTVSFRMDSTINYITNKRDTLTIRLDADSIYITEVSAPDTVIRYVTNIKRSPKDIERINELEKDLKHRDRKLKRMERMRNIAQVAFALSLFMFIILIIIAKWVKL